MAKQTFGQLLLNEKLPDDMQLDGPVTKGKLRGKMTELAKKDPQKYVQVVQDVKKVGDQVATWEGISVGLDDIAPDYEKRDKILNDALEKVKKAKSDDERRKILYDTEDKIKKITEEHPSDMTLMAKSGGRGSIPQLMKTVASPVVASASDGKAYPWLIKRSYAQGLSPSENWVAGSESRRNAIASANSVVEPGAVSKVIVSNMEDLVVTEQDCGARHGLQKDVDNRNILDRYLAKPVAGFRRNDLVTPSMVNRLKNKNIEKVEVRSPATCDVKDGVCQKCMGQNAWGKDYEIGMNVGSRSAQALTEPLTQFALNAKHGVRMVGGGDKHELTGLKGFKTLTEVPKSFTEKAALAKHDGKVTKIQKAPQGGHNIYVDNTRHYTPPRLDPIVKEGDFVEKGDALSEGTPMPNEVVAAKGVGEGRKYLSEALNNLYERQGADIDHRHTELLARKAMNYVQIENDPTDTLLEGDVVPFDKVKPLYRKNKNRVPLDQAKDKYLAEPVLHYTEGTRITPSVINKLEKEGVKHVSVAKKAPEFTPIMKSIVQTPLLKEDWMSRLSHRYLKKTLVEGAGFGYESDISSTNPVPAYVASNRFGHRPDGKYARLHDEPWSNEKVAAVSNLLRGTKRVLFGEGGEQFKNYLRQAKKRGDDPIRVIGEGGALDNAGFNARRWRDWVGKDKFDQLGVVDETGHVTGKGAHKLRVLEDAAKKDGIFGGRRMELDDEARRVLKDKADIDVDNVFDQETWRQMQERRGNIAKRLGRGIKDLTIGEAPLEVTKQRFRRGGVLGRGGLLLGDMGLSPDVVRSWRDMRSGDPSRKKGALGRMVLHGATDLGMDKMLSYGLPGMAVYEAATNPAEEGESQALNIATPLAETAGWGVGTPFGMLGGTMIAGQLTNATRALTGKMDPKAQQVLEREKMKSQDTAVHERALQDAHQTWQAHPWYAAGQYAHQGANVAQDYLGQQRSQWAQWNKQREQQKQHQQRQESMREGTRYKNVGGPPPSNHRLG